ncbi:EamA-like transporter family protein [Rubripirellula tenax]|uniref:EamA-like transporter family protein n=1 Tax=Rubripirellula tenax TaxID=2528015 RepID=A0A5C6F5Z4_9BACT|nr:EamA family transporter [Rubripirellula tenax]TWU56655.1 EamA-like transporter family protein [Rubripirellula tenax]
MTAALLYTLGILMLKRSTDWKPGPWRTTLFCNWVTAIIFLPMLWWGEPVHDWSLWWQPVVSGGFFAAGQTLVVLALTRGDVSVATPMLGLKILFVAVLLACFTDQSPSARTWPAAGLAVVAVACLSFRGQSLVPGSAKDDGSKASRFAMGKLSYTVITSIAAAVAYATFDSTVQVWAPRFCAATFLPLVMISSATFSLGMIPMLEGRFRDIPRPTWRWLLPGAALTGLQSVFLTYAIGTWGHAAATNVVYSSRGLWSVLAVVFVGQFFSREEYHAPRSVQAMRLLGALLIMIAIALIL